MVPENPRGFLVDYSWTSPGDTSIRGLREDFALCGRSGCGPTAALSRVYAEYPQPTRGKIRRSFVDFFEDEYSKIERGSCALRKVRLASCFRCTSTLVELPVQFVNAKAGGRTSVFANSVSPLRLAPSVRYYSSRHAPYRPVALDP